MFTGGMIAGWRIVVQSPLRAFRLGADALHRYKHGCVTVLRRDALESRACECYAAVKTVYHQLLGGHLT